LAPALIRIEVHGAIIRRYREGLLSLERSRQACSEWETALSQGLLRLVPDDNQISAARAFAFEIRHAIQDCLYLAVAAELNARLVTADPTFHARAASKFPFVELQCAPTLN
jgi:predicted nucleic acid-binding protein